MGKKVISNNEKCWCVNGSGCKDPTVGGMFKQMNKEISDILSKYGYILNGPMRVINKENGKHRNIWR